MRFRNFLQQVIGASIITLIMCGCSVPAPTTSPALPTDAPTAIQPTDMVTPVPPTDTPTAIPRTETPTSAPPVATATSADDVWKIKADMPTGRWEPTTCVVDGKIYAIGGAGPIYQALNTMEVYDPATDTWTMKSEMPTARQGLSASVVNGKIYAIGGGSSFTWGYTSVETFSTVEEYDPTTDTWATKSPMPTSRGWHSASVIGGKIYIIGGSQQSTPDDNHALQVEVYDPATDTWAQMGEMPNTRAAGSSGVVDGKIYIIGGYGGAQRIDEYDPSTETWTRKSDMPTKRNGLSATVVDGKIYVIGGYISGSASRMGVAIVEVYDPSMDTWTTATEMPTRRFGPSTSVVDGKIYVIGGMEYWSTAASGIVEVYDPTKE